jgi:hypothetical protein
VKILELRRPRVLPHVARAPARLDLRVLDLTVYFFRLYKYFHEDVAGPIHRRRHGRELPGVVEQVPEAPPRDGRRDAPQVRRDAVGADELPVCAGCAIWLRDKCFLASIAIFAVWALGVLPGGPNYWWIWQLQSRIFNWDSCAGLTVCYDEYGRPCQWVAPLAKEYCAPLDELYG